MVSGLGNRTHEPLQKPVAKLKKSSITFLEFYLLYGTNHRGKKKTHLLDHASSKKGMHCFINFCQKKNTVKRGNAANLSPDFSTLVW